MPLPTMRWVWAAMLMLGASAVGCSSPCKAGDLTCYVTSMTWSDFGADGGDGIQGPLQKLVDVDLATLESLAAADGGNCVATDAGADAGGTSPCGATLQVAAIDSTVVFYEGGSTGALVGLDWTDPLGCRPAFCMSACPIGAECVGARCSPSMQDGLERAATLHWVTYNAPDGSDFDLRLIAVSAPGCPSDVSAAIANRVPGLHVSSPIFIEMQINSGGGTTTGSSGGTSGTTGTTGTAAGDYYANYNCGQVSGCTADFGHQTGSAGPFCSQASCDSWLSSYFPNGTCTTAPQYPITNAPPAGTCQ